MRHLRAWDRDPPDDVVWHGWFWSLTSAGAEARDLLVGLRRLVVGSDVRIAGEAFAPDSHVAGLLDPSQVALLRSALSASARPQPIRVLHTVPDHLQRATDCSLVIARTGFESDEVPTALLPNLRAVDELWVPQRANAHALAAQLPGRTVRHVPAYVDTTRFAPGSSRFARADVLTVGAVVTWEHRTAPELLLRAWSQAFAPTAPVRLLLLAETPDGRVLSAGEVSTRCSELGLARSTMAPIDVVSGTPADLLGAALYRAFDVFVLPSRYESFGRRALEAMACGVAVIGGDWGGLAGVLTSANGFPLRSGGVPAGHPALAGHPMLTGHPALAGPPVLAGPPALTGACWPEPDTEHLVHLLRGVLADPAQLGPLGERARADVVTQHGETVLVELAERLVELGGQLRSTGARARAVAATRAGAIGVRWVGDQPGSHSYSVCNRNWCTHLVHDPGLLIELVSVGADAGTPIWDADPDLAAATLARSDTPAVEVRFTWPPRFEPPTDPGTRLVLVQPWEYGGLPDTWIPPLASLDEVWTISNYNRDCFVAAGMPADRVQVIPLGVAPEFTPEGPRLELDERADTSVRFLFAGGTTARKGFDVALKAYLRAFGPDDDVCLVVKSHGSGDHYAGINLDEFVREVANDPTKARVVLLDTHLSTAELAALYRSVDALLLPFRGEGFGLTAAEAICCGTAALVTDHGPGPDLIADGGGWLIPATEIGLPDVGGQRSALGFTMGEPDEDTLVGLLRLIAADPAQAHRRGRAAAGPGRARWSWAAGADVAAQRLRAVAVRPVRRLEQLGGPQLELGPGGGVLALPDWRSDEPEQVVSWFSAAPTPAGQQQATLVLVVDPARGVPFSVAASRAAQALSGPGGDDVDVLLLPLPASPHAVGPMASQCSQVWDSPLARKLLSSDATVTWVGVRLPAQTASSDCQLRQPAGP